MKLHQLEALVASAETGSVRSAARRLGVSQPAVTRALRELEAEQQLPLLLRSPAGLSFTAHGQALLAHARLILNQMRQAEEQMSLRRGRLEGRLCVGVTPWVSLILLPHALRSFRRQMPEVRLEFFDSFAMIAQPLLRDGSMDLAVGQPSPGMSPQEFRIEPILRYQTGIMVRRGHPRAGCASIHDLLDQDWLLNFAPDGRERLIDELFTRHGVHLDEARIVQANSALLAQALVEQGDMCTWVPKIMAVAPMFEGRTMILALREQFRTCDLCLISRRNTPPSPAAEAFVHCLKASVREQAQKARQWGELLRPAAER
ncbi:LysR family transcriptional regulator [Paracoccus binzhouensis]|uniref:LysR family transcriptional regulator n=1 Tax=Paracoccus binzhouensis TaxID=2796149 RepID=UPI0018EF19F6|nr:LysR substrate-binding domain-containing protein [Paracoccus binzhouensis]